MGKTLRHSAKVVRIVAVFLTLAVIYFCATYRDYTGIYNNKIQKRDTTVALIIHHDDIPHQTCVDDIETQHRFINGWESGFGYTYYLMDGKVYQMHGINDVNPSAYGFNSNAVSICIHDEDRYKLRTRANLFLLIWFVKIKYELKTSQIVGHGELPNNSTTCPDMDMDSLRSLFFDIKLREWN